MGFASRGAANALRVVRLPALRAFDRAAKSRALWLVVPLGSDLDELGRPSFSFGSFGSQGDLGGLSFLEVIRSLDRAASDSRLAGVLLCFTGPGPFRWSQVAALRRAITVLRRASLPVVAWAESLSAPQYLLASAADRVLLPESGTLQLVGLRSEQFYWKDFLDKLEVEPEIVHVGRFKSAGEVATRRSMSPEQREQVEAWQADLFGELLRAIGEGRGLDEAAARDSIDRGPYAARAACEAGLIDGCLYRDQLERELEGLSREPNEASSRDGATAPRSIRWLELPAYAASVVADAGWRPWWHDLPRLAYVVATGLIQRGSGRRGITSEGLGQLLASLREDRRVRGVVLRVDSGGGDALASDLLHRSVELVTREKPVVVSMGDVAASGGYYMAAPADAIFAEVGTVTGSIGVVGGKINLEGLYRRLGISKDGVESGARAGLLSESRAFTPDERQAVRHEMESLYDVFLDRVASGRHLARDQVHEVAQGRIWSGARAATVGLVDTLGGPLEALQDARRRAGIGEWETCLVDMLPRRPRLPDLRSLLFGG